MPQSEQGRITFDGLTQFLTRIGFEQSARLSNSIAFHHQRTGTIVMVSIPEDRVTVRPADLLSISMRLENQGLVDNSMLSELRLGRLPKAS